jgi:hypothetical protein
MKRGLNRFFSLLWHIFLLLSLLILMIPGAALAAGGDIIVSGPGLNNSEPVVITQAQLRGESPLSDGTSYLRQHDIIYSTINTWPTKSWYRGKGVLLTDLLEAAGGLNPDATQIRFTSRDGFKATFSVQEIVYTPRYCFPNFMSTGLPGHLPGDASNPVEVKAIIAHQSVSASFYEDILDDGYLSSKDSNLLLYGQRAVTEQTNSRFAKYVEKIEVLTDPVPEWDNPTATPEPGVVSVGTLVELRSIYNDEDKIHYTLDGSDPTIESPMYNWIASRWWSSREDELAQINKPIEITKNTTIKAIVIGPGRADSDIVTFEYLVSLENPPELTADTSDNKVGQDIEIIFIDNEAWRNAVAEVRINDALLDRDKYVLEASKLIIFSGVFTGAGDYTILIKAHGYHDATVTQTIMGSSGGSGGSGGSGENPKKPPSLTADTDENYIGAPIRITFSDDPDWRKNISEIRVDGNALNKGNYTIGAGYIELADTVFTSAGSYAILVKAEGYSDASVTQRIIGNKDIVLTITGEGVAKTKTFTLNDLENMPQHKYVYSVINTWPSKSWYVGEGVKLDDLLDEAGGITKDATLVRVSSSDGYVMTFTVDELLEDTRYCFPNFKEGASDSDGHIPGSTKGKKVVGTILALKGAEGLDIPDDDDMNKVNSPQLMLGQRAVTEQTGPLFVKKTSKIEVLTSSIPKWDEPKAEPAGGTVPYGTMVRLSNKNMDLDKIYYTTDDTTPTLDSPMYNLVAKRWWSSRGKEKVEEINHPIEITKDTVIKAITIGPGKKPSDVVTFTYKVVEAPTGQSSKVSTDQDSVVRLGNEASIQIPAGALSGSDEVEVRIERVEAPTPAPEGFRFSGSVYEFTVDGKRSYSFLKKVIITLRFDPADVIEGENPVVYRYDEELGRWVNLGGVVNGSNISVEVNNVGKYAVFVAAKSSEQNLLDITGHWAEGSIRELVALGAVSGYPDGTFRPNNKISRAEFATVLVKALGLSPQKGKVFTDTAGHWAEQMISTAASLGIVSGYNEKIFGANDPVTREQMAALIVRAAKLTIIKEELSFTDKDKISAWARDAVTTAVKNEIISGYPDNTLRPKGNATRAEAVSVILKIVKNLGRDF